MLGFVHIPKTAGSTVNFILRNTFCLRHCSLLELGDVLTDADLELARRVYAHGLRCVSGHGLVDPYTHVRTPIDYFTFVREPKARAVSHYLHVKRSRNRVGGDLTFDAFVEDAKFADVQVTQLAGGRDLERAKATLDRFVFVGLTEHFTDSITALDRLVDGHLRLEHPRLHVTPNTAQGDAVRSDPDAMRRLAAANGLDQALYDYARETLFPRFLDEAGVTLGSTESGDLEIRRRTVRYWLSRWFQKGVYREIVKRRRRAQARDAASVAP